MFPTAFAVWDRLDRGVPTNGSLAARNILFTPLTPAELVCDLEGSFVALDMSQVQEDHAVMQYFCEVLTSKAKSLAE
jgi:hypothetical protein